MTVVVDFTAPADVTALADELADALANESSSQLEHLENASPGNRRDRFACLLHIYRLHSEPVHTLGLAARYQHHPVIAAIKARCESDWLVELAGLGVPAEPNERNAADTMRVLAARDRLPEIYKWVANDASWEDVVTFLALEGGPDAGFDDLVALCQIGLRGRAKLELATNYWDEMGQGRLSAVHTTLHDDLTKALDLPHLPMAGLPTSALERAALCGLLATNRWLQPEALGALGLIELQAGPRCRLILQAFDRCGAPAEAYPFYQVHAEVDPRHGQDWLNNAVEPIASEIPQWSTRIVRGAFWRATVNSGFFDDAQRMLSP